MDALTFLDRLDKAKPLPFYVLHGDESFLVRQALLGRAVGERPQLLLGHLLHELVDEERWGPHVGVEQSPVAGLERVGAEEVGAEIEPDPQVGPGVRVLDHIIVGDGRCLSFAERGLL